MRAALAILLATALGLGTAFLAACGERNDLLSSGSAESLRGELDGVSAAVAAGNCDRAARAASRLSSEVGGLPTTIDRRLRANLLQGAQTVSRLADEQCLPATTAPSTTTRSTKATTTTAPPPVTQAPPPTTTATTETTAPPPPDTQTETETTTPTPPPTPPPDNGGGARPGGGGTGPPGQGEPPGRGPSGGGAPGRGGPAQ